MQIIIEIPDDKIPTKQCYKDVLIKFVDKQVCEVTMIGQIPRKDETELWFDVLPEGHGRLKDIDEIKWYGCTSEDDCPYKNRDCKDCNRAECSKTQVDSIPVLIPADKENT